MELAGCERQKECKEIHIFVIEVIYVKNPDSCDGRRLL